MTPAREPALQGTTFNIRAEMAADRSAIAALIGFAFDGVEYSDGSEPLIVEQLRSEGDLAVSLVAVENSAIIGHVAFSPVTIGGVASGWFGLGPVCVRPDWQRRGVGSALIGEGLRRLRDIAAAGCVVLGDPRYYARFGFASDLRLSYPGAPPEYFTGLLLSAREAPRGCVTYATAFGTPTNSTAA